MLVDAGSATSKLEQETNEKEANNDKKHIKKNPRLEMEEAEILQLTSQSSWWRPRGGPKLVTAPLLPCWRQAEAADHRTQSWRGGRA